MSPFRIERLEERCLLSSVAANLEAAPISDTQIELRWTATPPSPSYLQRVQGDGAFQTVSSLLPDTTTSFIDTTGSPNTAYQYRLLEQDQNGVPTGYSNVVPVSTNPPQLSRKIIQLDPGSQAVSGNPSPTVSMGGVGYFSTGEAQLWRTDGTAGATTMVKSFNDHPSNIGQITAVNGTLYFALRQVTSAGVDVSIWKSDGTSDGTVLVTDLPHDGSSNTFVISMIDFGGALYFTTTGTSPLSLWRTDGTAAGSILVKRFDNDGLGQLAVANGKLLIGGPVESAGAGELWVSDGTTAGTVQLSGSNGNPLNLTRFYPQSNRVFFVAANAASRMGGLWVTDGTPSGTVQLTTTVEPDFFQPATLGTDLFFLAYSGTPSTLHLWKSDGTIAGTVPVSDLHLASTSARSGDKYHVQAVGDRLVFETDDYTSTSTLWVSDGTDLGTSPLRQFSLLAPNFAPISQLTTVDGAAYFTAPDLRGGALWRTDGTAAGTTRVIAAPQPPTNLRQLGHLLTFTGFDPVHGYEFWASDGTAAGTALVANTAPETPAPQRISGLSLTSADGSLLFETTTSEFWKSDGTQGGTVKLSDEGLRFLGSANGTWFFSGSDDRLWVSDHTPAGTQPITAPLNTLNPALGLVGLGTGGNKFFFYVPTTGTTLPNIWVSDGTPAGTMPMSQTLSPAAGFGTSSNYLYFVPSQLTFANPNPGVYRTDGTPAGTIRLTNATPVVPTQNTFISPNFAFTDVNGTMYFFANNPNVGLGLMRSDGTPQGTVFLHSFAGVNWMTDINGKLYFIGSQGGNDFELWTSDGTPQGTQRVPIPALNGPAGPIGSVGGLIYLVENQLKELWRTDGTSQGTFMVYTANSSPYALNATLSDLTPAGGKEYFENYGALWVTDGTAWGTHQVDGILQHRALFALPIVLNGNIYGQDFTTEDAIRFVDTSPPAAAPTSLTVTKTLASVSAPATVRLDWTDAPSNNDSGFIIERSAHTDFSTIDGEFWAPQGATTFSDTNSTDVSYYRIRAINAAGTTDFAPGASPTFTLLRGAVFRDDNYNGVRDAGEQPMAGVTIFLDANNNGILDPGETSVTTGPDGQFTFDGLASGTYTLREITPSGYRRTTPLLADPTFIAGGQVSVVPDIGHVAPSAVRLDFAYLLTLVQHYGQSGALAAGDLNGDDRITLDDLLLLAQNYNGTLSPATLLNAQRGTQLVRSSRSAAVRGRIVERGR